MYETLDLSVIKLFSRLSWNICIILCRVFGNLWLHNEHSYIILSCIVGLSFSLMAVPVKNKAIYFDWGFCRRQRIIAGLIATIKLEYTISLASTMS